MHRAPNSQPPPIFQTYVNCRPVTSVKLKAISARKHKVKPEKSPRTPRNNVKQSSRKWPTKPTIKRKQSIPPQSTKVKSKKINVCSPTRTISDDDAIQACTSASIKPLIFSLLPFDCLPQSARSLENSRKFELATECYVDNRPFNSFWDEHDDHMWTNEKDNRKTVCAEEQMELDMAMLQQNGFESSFVDAKLSSDAKRIWKVRQNLENTIQSTNWRLRASNCFNIRPFRMFPKYRYSKFGF